MAQLSQQGVRFISRFEGFNPNPYSDYGQTSIGYGSKASRAPSSHITKEQGRQLLIREVNREYAPAVTRVAREAGLNLTQNQADALISAVYNLGPGVLDRGRSLGDALRSGSGWERRAASALKQYTHAGGSVLPGLVSRRNAESELLLKRGGPSSSPAPSSPKNRAAAGSPVVDRTARVQALQRFLSGKNSDPVGLALQIRSIKDQERAAASPSRRKPRREPSRRENRRLGNYSVEAGANRAGAGLTGDMKQFLEGMTSSGRSVKVTTGTNHSKMTSTGNVSDHWSGNGVDIGSSANGFPATGGGTGDLIAAHAIKRASGKSWGDALKLAQRGGAYTFHRNGKRTQVIWKSNVGGNHFNHVHVGRG